MTGRGRPQRSGPVNATGGAIHGAAEEVEAKPGGRAITEEALERAAMALLRRDGVLAGLNLREVADEAGVNRGLVYHYYGSRGKLLRRALRRFGQESRSQLSSQQNLPFRARWRSFFQTTITHPEAIELTTLLLLDGTEPLRAMPFLERTQLGLRRGVQEGDIDPDLDLLAFHTLFVTATYGYTLYRERFARELGVDVADLDARVSGLIHDRLLVALRPRADHGATSLGGIAEGKAGSTPDGVAP